MAGNVLPRTLGVDREQPDFAVRELVVVDDADTAALPATLALPAHFPTSAGTRNHIPHIGVVGEPGAELSALVFRPVVGYKALEEQGFNDCQQELVIRQ